MSKPTDDRPELQNGWKYFDDEPPPSGRKVLVTRFPQIATTDGQQKHIEIATTDGQQKHIEIATPVRTPAIGTWCDEDGTSGSGFVAWHPLPGPAYTLREPVGTKGPTVYNNISRTIEATHCQYTALIKDFDNPPIGATRAIAWVNIPHIEANRPELTCGEIFIETSQPLSGRLAKDLANSIFTFDRLLQYPPSTWSPIPLCKTPSESLEKFSDAYGYSLGCFGCFETECLAHYIVVFLKENGDDWNTPFSLDDLQPLSVVGEPSPRRLMHHKHSNPGDGPDYECPIHRFLEEVTTETGSPKDGFWRVNSLFIFNVSRRPQDERRKSQES